MFDNDTTHNLYRIQVMKTSVLDLMKIGIIALRVGFEPPPFHSWDNMLLITHVPYCNHVSHPYMYEWLRS